MLLRRIALNARVVARSFATAHRDPRFAKVTPQLLEKFADVVSTPQSSIISSLSGGQWSTVNFEELSTYNEDWMGRYKGKSTCVVRPKSTEELSQIMRICYENNVAVVPQGGNTGLVGGGVPVFDEVIVSLSNMNRVRSFDATAGTLVCDAGCILETLDAHVAQHGYMMPLDLGAKGTCHIGGNVATNAGGLRFLRYGSLHGSVLGLEVVLPNGDILDNLTTLRKDNTGFDLKQLFIGSEGSIGVITGVSITTPRRPLATNVAVFGVPSFEAVQTTFQKAKQHCAEILSAYEFIDEETYGLVQANASHGVRDVFSMHHPMYVLIETSGSCKTHDDEKLQGLLEELLEEGIVNDGVVAQDEKQVQSLWSIRESAPEAYSRLGKVYKYDISMPIEHMYELVEHMRKHYDHAGLLDRPDRPGLVKAVGGYGHVGDGNLHINIAAERYDAAISDATVPHIYEWIKAVK